MVPVSDVLALLLVAFAGGAFGAAIGALPAFSLAGVLIVVGETVAVASEAAAEPGVNLTALGATGITASLGLGPGFGPHVAFAGGIAATAFAARQGRMDTGFDYHEAKNVAHSLGPRSGALLVGGLFGVLGVGLTQASVSARLPWDPIAFSIVVSGFLHRIALGYPLVGRVRGENVLDMSPFERGRRRSALGDAGERTDGAGNAGARLAVEPWLPHQYAWGQVALLGTVVGVLSAFVTYRTGSPFLAFGITAATLVFLCLGAERFPVTHHMALPASFAVVGLAGGALTPEGVAAGTTLPGALLVGGLFGLVCGLAGELAQRLFYAHADTHLDPPAVAIVVGTLLVALLDVAGVFEQPLLPTLGL